MLPPTERFSNRVADYVRYRPSYPPGVLELLRSECGLNAGSVVADVGAGTGIFTRLLLEAGAEVYAVEPNDAMREAAEVASGDDPRFHAVSATAEATGLASSSVDLITCAQAWHWFANEATEAEFRRILKPGGYLALVWNERLTEGADAFHDAYETLLATTAPEYGVVRHQEFNAKRLGAVFGPEPMRVGTFENSQEFDLTGLIGRAMSSSYAPAAGTPGHEGFVASLAELFAAHAVNDRVTFRYVTQVYYGHLAPMSRLDGEAV